MIVAGGHIRDFGYYLARSNAIMYNIIELLDRHRRMENIAGFNFCAFSFVCQMTENLKQLTLLDLRFAGLASAKTINKHEAKK